MVHRVRAGEFCLWLKQNYFIHVCKNMCNIFKNICTLIFKSKKKFEFPLDVLNRNTFSLHKIYQSETFCIKMSTIFSYFLVVY